MFNFRKMFSLTIQELQVPKECAYSGLICDSVTGTSPLLCSNSNLQTLESHSSVSKWPKCFKCSDSLLACSSRTAQIHTNTSQSSGLDARWLGGHVGVGVIQFHLVKLLNDRITLGGVGGVPLPGHRPGCAPSHPTTRVLAVSKVNHSLSR